MAQFTAATIHECLQIARDISPNLGRVNVDGIAPWQTEFNVWVDVVLVIHYPIDRVASDC